MPYTCRNYTLKAYLGKDLLCVVLGDGIVLHPGQRNRIDFIIVTPARVCVRYMDVDTEERKYPGEYIALFEIINM